MCGEQEFFINTEFEKPKKTGHFLVKNAKQNWHLKSDLGSNLTCDQVIIWLIIDK